MEACDLPPALDGRGCAAGCAASPTGSAPHEAQQGTGRDGNLEQRLRDLQQAEALYLSGHRYIPNDNLEYRMYSDGAANDPNRDSCLGPRSHLTIQDANVLRIQVKYGSVYGFGVPGGAQD